MTKLSTEDFRHVVKNTPLVSIDLIIENEKGEILLGKRKNPPAKDYFFVPGGRIVKNESFITAFERITRVELGIDMSLKDASFEGIFDHIYPGENFNNFEGFGTHYVVNAFRINLEKTINHLPKEQHTEYWWALPDDILKSKNVHQNTKNYFNNTQPFSGRVRK